MNHTQKLLLSLCLSVGLTASALAHGGATGIVKERMDSMVAMGKIMKTLSGYITGQAPYDAEAVSKAAAKLQSHAGESLVSLFPHGSNPAVSEARDTIWSDKEGFAEIANELDALSAALVVAAPNGLVANAQPVPDVALTDLPANVLFHAIGQTCKSCHSDFRIKK